MKTRVLALLVGGLVTSQAAESPSIAFSTYLGGSRQSRGAAIAIGNDGTVYVAGRTQAKDFPQVRAAQPDYGGGENDAFVVKLSPDGQQFVYATLLGGRDVDFADSITVDAAGNAYVAGTTYSRNFPTTKGAAQRSHGGGDRDGFVVKLTPDGRVVFATLLGGDGTDRVTSIAVDAGGYVYVTGSTNSADFARPAAPRSDWDVLIAKLDPNGSRVVFASRVGGSAGRAPERGGFGGESGTAIEVAPDGALYIAGYTDSADFPLTSGMGRAGGGSDGFVFRMADSGLPLLASRVLGGRGSDRIAALAVDAAGNVVAAGTTEPYDAPTGNVLQHPKGATTTSNDFPTVHAVRPTWTAFMRSAFVTKLAPGLAEIRYSTYLGGSSIDTASDVAVDAAGNALVVGTAQSNDFPLVRAIQRQAGNADVFITTISVDGSALLFSTYLGARTHDTGSAIAVGPSGDVVVTGHSGYGGVRRGDGYADFPTVRPLQPDRGTAPFVAFVTRISTAGTR